MSQTHDKPPPTEDVAQILAELEDAISRQLDLAVRDNLDALDGMEPTIVDLLNRLKQVGLPTGGELAEHLKRIDQLHRRLCLTLAQKRQEGAEKLAQARQGKAAMRAYGRRK